MTYVDYFNFTLIKNDKQRTLNRDKKKMKHIKRKIIEIENIFQIQSFIKYVVKSLLLKRMALF